MPKSARIRDFPEKQGKGQQRGTNLNLINGNAKEYLQISIMHKHYTAIMKKPHLNHATIAH